TGENRSHHRSRGKRVMDVVLVGVQARCRGRAALLDGRNQQAVSLLAGFERAPRFAQLHSEWSRKLALAVELLQTPELLRRQPALFLLIARDFTALIGWLRIGRSARRLLLRRAGRIRRISGRNFRGAGLRVVQVGRRRNQVRWRSGRRGIGRWRDSSARRRG